MTCRLVLFLVSLISSIEASPRKSDQPNFIIILTDDQGWSDFSPNKTYLDLKTPNIDQLVDSGTLITNGYTSAPQCVPARVGLLLGKNQSRIGIERNGEPLDPFKKESNIAEKLSGKGYETAIVGKWHLGPAIEIPSHGFRFFYNHTSSAPFWTNFNRGKALGDPQKIQKTEYHIDSCSETATTLIRKFAQKPFFLFLSYRAPHVPLDASTGYLSKFSNDLPMARKQALAMLAAMDDGIGSIIEELEQLNLTDQTCIFFLSDNGAPLKLDAKDANHPTLGWNGSYNAPLTGEKGMLTEGGIRVPFSVTWPGTIPAGKVFHEPVTSLDIMPTILAQVGITPHELDGVNLMPYLKGARSDPPHEFLCWRWVIQSAIRKGDWKFLKCKERKYLFNLKKDVSEKQNLIMEFPQMANELAKTLADWSEALIPSGLEKGELTEIWTDYFDYHLGAQ